MNPFFFGDNKNLFGIYHSPGAERDLRTSVLICNPIGHEYIRSYQVVRRLAKRLSSEGYHVLRFDYSCTGDSHGESTSADLLAWYSDIDTAAKELMEISGSENLLQIGIRLGATLLVNLSSEGYKPDASRTILWDPVISGEDYLDKMQAMHREMSEDANRYLIYDDKNVSAKYEWLGYKYNEKLLEQLKRLSFSSGSLHNVSVISTVGEHYNDFDTSRLHIETVKENCNWDDINKIEDFILVKELPDYIVKAVK